MATCCVTYKKLIMRAMCMKCLLLYSIIIMLLKVGLGVLYAI